MATNWDEAGREETSPENDYTNNEVRPTTYSPPTHSLPSHHLAVPRPYGRNSPGAHGPPSIPKHLAYTFYLPLNQASLAIHIQDHTVTVLSSAQVHQQCPNDSAGARAANRRAGDKEP